MSIFDLQETILQQEVMKLILDRMESEEVVKLNRAQAGGGNAAGRLRREKEKRASSDKEDSDTDKMVEMLKEMKEIEAVYSNQIPSYSCLKST